MIQIYTDLYRSAIVGLPIHKKNIRESTSIMDGHDGHRPISRHRNDQNKTMKPPNNFKIMN